MNCSVLWGRKRTGEIAENVNLFLYLVVVSFCRSGGGTLVADLVKDPEWPKLVQPVNYKPSPNTDT